ncbi:potassium-transporting ATPase subunit KdpA [Candidatus Binatus sp.]|uniref:potassium-transporting ATPase subunit KdpA n=1 Tax=Candidatus Binatus sp. TaxID=2811406 RepID=UPI003D0D67DD
MWLLPISMLLTTALLAIPLSRYLAWIMNGEYKAPGFLKWFEDRLDTGNLNWKQYTVALLVFNALLFTYSYVIMAIQPWMPLNELHRGMLAPTTMAHAAMSLSTNTDLQHWSGDVHFSNFSQIFVMIANFFFSASIGFCALAAIIRALRFGPDKVGSFFLDMWRVMIYMFLPVGFVFSLICLQQGMPMTFKSAHIVPTLEPAAMGTTDSGQAKQQTIVVGPLAAFIPMKQLGTNGGGFFGANSAHPFENPTALTNFLESVAMMLFPMALVLMYGRMLHKLKHAWVIFSVMMGLMIGTVVWTVYFDTYKPNPGITAHPQERHFEIATASGKKPVVLPAVAGLPVDQHLGNLESKELRFGTSAGATFAAMTVDVTCGAVNCAHDSLNPMAAISPMAGMWVNCIYGGKGVGMINMLVFLIIGVFVAGQMVGRTPEYLGKKIGGREMKLAMIGLLIHPIMILWPTGIFAATSWGQKAEFNPGPHGFSEIMYEFSSASANNGSGFEGLGDTWGLNDNPSPAPTSRPWDIATVIVICLSRFIPIIAPIALAAGMGAKKAAPFGLGTMRDDTPTFAFLLTGTIVILGALLFLPVAALGPVAEHLGPLPFGG